MKRCNGEAMQDYAERQSAAVAAAGPRPGLGRQTTWQQARDHWSRGTAAPPRRRRRTGGRLLRRILDQDNPRLALGMAVLAWGSVVVLTLGLLEVITL
ncbi:MAG: hypothetical protein JWP04_929 [Belnapia sp.]|nr:hypothetical protein [Belnapia sp.]